MRTHFGTGFDSRYFAMNFSLFFGFLKFLGFMFHFVGISFVGAMK